MKFSKNEFSELRVLFHADKNWKFLNYSEKTKLQ